MENKLPKIIVICGPTASGKTALSLALAKKYQGEIISADSRQVYQEMDIGTAKEPGEWVQGKYLVQKIPHYLIDISSPKGNFSAAELMNKAKGSIKNILKNNKNVFIVGGTGLYLDSLINNYAIPKVATNLVLRKSLEEKNLEDLKKILKKLDPETYNKIDLKNKRRLSRALEVVSQTGESFSKMQKKGKKLYKVLYIGIAVSREVLYDRINKRVELQIQAGLVEEVEKLAHKYGWDLIAMSGIGYRQFRDYLAGKISLAMAIEQLKKDTRNYAKRQLTWFKRNKAIRWVESRTEADQLVNNFLRKK